VHKYNRLLRITAVIIFVGFFWITAVFLTVSFPVKNESLKQFLPDEVEVIVSLNTEQLIKTFLFDALYKSEFNSKDIKQLEKATQSKRSESNGIMYNGEVVFFYDIWRNIPIQGLLFNLSNHKAFQDFSPEGKNIIKASNGKQGMILTLKKDADEELIQYAQSFADRFSNKKGHGDLVQSEMMRLNYKGNKHTYIQDLELDIQFNNEKVSLNGVGKKNQGLNFSVEKYHMLKTPNRPFLEFQSGKLPDSIYKFFKLIFDEVNIDVPEVTSQQMMIYGSSIQNIDGSIAYLPKLDWILRFDTIVNIDDQLSTIDSSTYNMQVINKKVIEIGGIPYYYKQISDHEIFIGVTESPEIELRQTQILPFIKGNPSVVLEVEGKGIIAQIFNVMPQVKYTKLFMENISYFDIHTFNGEADDLIIEGEVKLKDGKMMTVELVKFALMFM